MSRFFTIALIATLFVAAAFAQNNATNATTLAPNATTAAATTTAAPVTTTAVPATTAAVNATTAAPNATNTTRAPNATTAAPATVTPTPEVTSPAVTVTLNTTLASFNATDFTIRSAAVMGVAASSIIIDSTTAGSVIVVFRVRSTSASAAAASAETFRTGYATNTAFTSAYKVLAVTVAATPVPVAVVYSNPITIALDTTLAVFNQELFRQKAAAVVGISSDNIQVVSATAGSVLVVFRIATTSAANAHSLATVFVNTVSSNAGFTGAYKALAVSYSAASSATNVIFALLLALLLVAMRM